MGALDTLLGSSARTLKIGPTHTQQNDWRGGTVLSTKEKQERDVKYNSTTKQYESGELKTYPKSGDPIMGLAVTLQTKLREDADDDGQRTLFLEGRGLKQAAGKAIVAAGLKDLAPGAEIYVRWTGQERDEANPNLTPRTLWDVMVRPAASPLVQAAEQQSAPAGVPAQSAPAASQPAPGGNAPWDSPGPASSTTAPPPWA